MINVNVPETRGVALALQSVTDDLGKGLGPVIVAGGFWGFLGGGERLLSPATRMVGAGRRSAAAFGGGGLSG